MNSVLRYENAGFRKLGILALAGFSFLQFLILLFSLLFRPAFIRGAAFEGFSAIAYFVLVLVSVVTVRRFLRADLWHRSIFFSAYHPLILVGCLGLGFLPALFSLLVGSFFLGARWIPPMLPPSLVGLSLVVLLHAWTQVLAFRGVPLALMERGKTFLAFLIPTVALLLAYRIGGTPIGHPGWWIFELGSVSLLLFLVALEFGLLPAALVHFGINLSYALASETLLSIDSPPSLKCAAVWVAVLVFLMISIRGRRRRVRARDFTLSLTPM